MKTKFTTHKKQLSALICAALLGFSWHEGGVAKTFNLTLTYPNTKTPIQDC